MRKPINFNKVGADLNLVQKCYPQRFGRKQFASKMTNNLRKSEIERLFDALCKEGFVVALTKTTYKFVTAANFFNGDKLIQLFDQYHIIVPTGWHCLSEEKREEAIRKRKESFAKTMAAKKAVKSTSQPIVKEIDMTAHIQATIEGLASFSDDELLVELNRRQQIRERRAKLQEILEVAELSIDELKQLIESV